MKTDDPRVAPLKRIEVNIHNKAEDDPKYMHINVAIDTPIPKALRTMAEWIEVSERGESKELPDRI